LVCEFEFELSSLPPQPNNAAEETSASANVFFTRHTLFMKVFVAGATGVIGRPLVRALTEAGHEVVGTTRSEGRAGRIRADGGRPVILDALDRDAVIAAVADARPDAVVHQLTQIPADMNPRKMREEFLVTDRLRTEGTRNLVDAAQAAGVQRIVAQSIAFAYRMDGNGLKTEDDALLGDDAPATFQRTVEAVATLERTVLDAGGIVLRYGYFYGPGTSYAASDGPTAARVRKRGFPVVGDGGGVFPFIHVDDAATATVAALDRGDPGVYNIVDDDPAPLREWLPVYAEAVGAKPPRRVPKLAARIAAGKMAAEGATKMRGVSNEKAKSELGWEPRYASWRQGFFEGAG
jgi:2-alkyl-3-oxoalkanoate reductase